MKKIVYDRNKAIKYAVEYSADEIYELDGVDY